MALSIFGNRSMLPNVRLLARGALLLLIMRLAPAIADDAAAPVSRDKALHAIERGLQIVETGARNYPSHRDCFACHHQTLPLLGMTRAAAASIPIDRELSATIVAFTRKSFGDQIEGLREGKGIGGRGLTVGYGLWTLRIAESKPDELTDAMVAYLLKTQEDDGHWGLHAIRPPAEESLVMCTVLAAAGIRTFATPARQEPATAALTKARHWLATADLPAHEDRVARLLGFSWLGEDDGDLLARAREAVLKTQSPDGGWSQLPDRESDAYATATALYALWETRAGEQKTTALPADAFDRAVARGKEWLVRNQLPDGSWHVQTRAKPVQEFFDNGDPHGKDQFLSISATGWATAALANSLFGDRPQTVPGR
jgi:N-acyl-D-amino-acid deacylase